MEGSDTELSGGAIEGSDRVTYIQRTEISPGVVLHLDVGYLRTLPGIVKCVALGLDVLCFIILLILGSAVRFSGTFWSMLICSTAITVTLTLLLLYLFRIVDILSQIPWIVSEMIFCFTWTIFYFIVASVLAIAASSYNHFGFGIAALFAFGAMATYGFDCFLKFLAWKRNETAHGGDPSQVYGDTINLSSDGQTNPSAYES